MMHMYCIHKLHKIYVFIAGFTLRREMINTNLQVIIDTHSERIQEAIAGALMDKTLPLPPSVMRPFGNGQRYDNGGSIDISALQSALQSQSIGGGSGSLGASSGAAERRGFRSDPRDVFEDALARLAGASSDLRTQQQQQQQQQQRYMDVAAAEDQRSSIGSITHLL